MLLGIVVAARAGSLRDRGKKPEHRDRGVTVKGSFLAGLVVAICAGLLSSALNFSYAFGREVLTQARHLGVSPVWVSNVVAAPATTGGLGVYGLGIYRMGDFGTVVGWPLLMGTIIITSNAAGFLTGEWARTGTRVRAYLGAGMAIILLALWLLALAQKA
jgi:L-rhamnose-H+ transport protein